MSTTTTMGYGTGILNDASTPFWNVNVPTHRQTDRCPAYLEYAFRNDKDRMILSTWDVDYLRQPWPEVQRIIRDNRLDLFMRLPSDLRRYREYCAKLVKQYGSVMEYVVRERLRWTDLTPRGERPFDCGEDSRVLFNDWPYGVDERTVHLVVWTKFDLESDPTTDDLTDQARGEIEAFVERVFIEPCGSENVIWFRNWSTLQSIHAVPHFHVMLFDPDLDWVRHVTGGDVAMSERLHVQHRDADVRSWLAKAKTAEDLREILGYENDCP